MNYRETLTPILKLAGELIVELRKQGLQQERKADATLVTNADKACSDFLTAALLAAYPGDGIVSEEHADTSGVGARMTWVIDPIDGTKHYAAGGPLFCIMVARFDTQPIFSMMYYPILDRWFWAERGKGAFVQEKGTVTQLHVRTPSEPPFVVSSEDSPLRVGEPSTRGTMKYLSRVALGKLDCAVKGPVGYWDLVPPMLLVQEAGGVVVDYAGNEFSLTRPDAVQPEVIAGHPATVQQVVSSK